MAQTKNMISYRQADLLDLVNPKPKPEEWSVVIGLDTMYIYTSSPNANFLATNMYTIPFAKSGTISAQTKELISKRLEQVYKDDPILTGWETITNNAEYNEMHEVSHINLNESLAEIGTVARGILEEEQLGFKILDMKYSSDDLNVIFKIQ